MKHRWAFLIAIIAAFVIAAMSCQGGGESAGSVWVEEITIGPEQPYLGAVDIRLVCVNLRASEAAFGEHSAIGCKVELWSGNYYYGHYNIYLQEAHADSIERSGVDLFYPVPADEPVFQSGGSFNTKVSASATYLEVWGSPPDETWLGLHDNPYKGAVQ